MKINILYIILFLYPLVIKSMEEILPEKKEKKSGSGYSSSDGSWRDSIGIRKKRAKSMLKDAETETEDRSSSSVSSAELSDSGEIPEIDVLDLLTIYFNKTHTGNEPYCGATRRVLTKCKYEAPERFKQLSQFLDSIKNDKKKRNKFHNNFLLIDKENRDINDIITKIIDETITSMSNRKKEGIKKSRWVSRSLTGACIGTFALCMTALFATIIPVIVHCT